MTSSPFCVKPCLLNRDWVDDRLHAAGDSCWTKREQELPGLVFYHLFGVDVFENMNAVSRNQDLVDLEHAGVFFKRNHFKTPRVGSDHRDSQRREILRAIATESGSR